MSADRQLFCRGGLRLAPELSYTLSERRVGRAVLRQLVQDDLLAGVPPAPGGLFAPGLEHVVRRRERPCRILAGSAALVHPGYAQEQQVPASKHALFLRADWTDAFVFKLGLTAFANINLYDGSTLAQVTASYSVTDYWTVAVIGAAYVGSRQSEFGSFPTVLSGLFTLRRHF